MILPERSAASLLAKAGGICQPAGSDKPEGNIIIKRAGENDDIPLLVRNELLQIVLNKS